MSELTLYELPPSPNSIKVRLALGLKGIEHKRVMVNPMDRSVVVELSGQPLTPVLTDGERVIYDSYAILRYLDANHPDGPRLYSADRDEQKAIEEWELFGRVKLGEYVGVMFGQFFAPEKDPAAFKRANELLAKRAGKLEDALADQDFLLGERPTAADLTCAPFVSYGLLEAKEHKEGSIARFFAEHLRLPERFPRTRAWVARTMAFDCARA
jgi:glutathione S-transferase